MNSTPDATMVPPRWARLALILLLAGGTLAGCVAAVGTAVVGGTMMAVDRRSTGTQVDDQTIEIRAGEAVRAAIGERGRVNVTSYNRVALVTGEVPTQADRDAVAAAVRKVENVRAVVDELAVMPNATFSRITDDSIITGKVKVAILDVKELQVASIKVVTERGVVYLMGLVTEQESRVAGTVARTIAGVKKVVKVFEIITPAQLAAMPFPPNAAAPAASAASAPAAAAASAAVSSPPVAAPPAAPASGPVSTPVK